MEFEFELRPINIIAYWDIFIETMSQTYPYNLLSRIPLYGMNVVDNGKQLDWKSFMCLWNFIVIDKLICLFCLHIFMFSIFCLVRISLR